MKFTIKTLDQKTVVVDFCEEKTVWDLKNYLFTLPDITVQPELQLIIYAGRILENASPLSAYSIDERKFLVLMSKKPIQTPKMTKTDKNETEQLNKIQNEQQKPTKIPTKIPIYKINSTTNPVPLAYSPIPVPPNTIPNVRKNGNRDLLSGMDKSPTTTIDEQLVMDITNMGYPEMDVRRALLASFNNPDRAICYLIDGIPQINVEQVEQINSNEMENNAPPTPMSPVEEEQINYETVHDNLRQNPELLPAALSLIGETNPNLLSLNSNQTTDYANIINEPFHEHAASIANLNDERLTQADLIAIQRLVELGFPRNIVIQVYLACNKNEEHTADLLFRQLED